MTPVQCANFILFIEKNKYRKELNFCDQLEQDSKEKIKIQESDDSGPRKIVKRDSNSWIIIYILFAYFLWFLLVYQKYLDSNIFVKSMGFITISFIQSVLANFPCLKNCIQWIKTVSMHLTRTLKWKTLRIKKVLSKVATRIKKTYHMGKSLGKKIISYLSFLICKSFNPTLSFLKVTLS